MDGSSGEWNSARVDAVRGMEKERKQAGYDQHGWQGDTKVVALFALPTFAAFIIGFVIPFIMGVYLSFCKFATVTDAEFVGLKNYKRAFADKEFLHALGFSTALTIITTIVINVVAFAIAYMLTKAIKLQHLPFGVLHAEPHRWHYPGLHLDAAAQRHSRSLGPRVDV